MRRALFLGVLLLVLPGAAEAATLTLRVEPAVARYGTIVGFAGELVPARGGVPVGVYARAGRQGRLIASGVTSAEGTYRLAGTAGEPGSYFAVAQPDPATQVVSAEASLAIRPRLAARVAGRRVVGSRLFLAGRLVPARAGRLRLAVAGTIRTVAVPASGRFRVVLPSGLPGRLRLSLSLVPAPGYERVSERRSVLVRAPSLGRGSAGAAVRALETRLHELRYALRSVDAYYGSDTYEAVLAFQKVHGISRTGLVGPSLWRRLARASVPRAFVPRGSHIEISKTKQVMFEVRDGRVVKAVHVSTGATGNTPVGRWRVYRVGPGSNALGMYYSLYFLRGFAIHGYASVPTYPASHGCVRTPIWFAPGFYSRWGLGSTVYVFP